MTKNIYINEKEESKIIEINGNKIKVPPGGQLRFDTPLLSSWQIFIIIMTIIIFPFFILYKINDIKNKNENVKNCKK